MGFVARLVRMKFDEEAERAGATRAHWTLIAAVARHPGATQKALAGILHISEVSAGRLVDRLCKEGLVTRRTDDEDRRVNRIHLTEAAHPVLDELSIIAARHEELAYAGLSDSELAEFDRLLELLHRNLAGAAYQAP